jgi:hypothetical protein
LPTWRFCWFAPVGFLCLFFCLDAGVFAMLQKNIQKSQELRVKNQDGKKHHPQPSVTAMMIFNNIEKININIQISTYKPILGIINKRIYPNTISHDQKLL